MRRVVARQEQVEVYREQGEEERALAEPDAALLPWLYTKDLEGVESVTPV